MAYLIFGTNPNISSLSQITKNEKWQFRNRAILPYSRVRDCLMLIRDYWGYLMTNNYQMKLSLFDDYFIVYLTPIILFQTLLSLHTHKHTHTTERKRASEWGRARAKIQREKTKCEYSVHNLQILTIIWWLLWLFELFDAIICKMNASPEFRTTRQNLEQRT